MSSLIQIIQEWYGLGLVFLAVAFSLGMNLSIQILLDLAWLAILSFTTGVTMKRVWPIILRTSTDPQHTIYEASIGIGVYGLLLTILDWLLLAYHRVSRIKGHLLPITTATAILWMTTIPLLSIVCIYMSYRWISTKINRVLDKRKSADMAQALKATTAPIDEVCGVCMDDFAKPMALPCRHIFCNECIRLALEKRPACPMCGRI